MKESITTTTTEKTIKKSLSYLIGQERLKNNLIEYFMAIKNGGKHNNFLLTGMAGLGKTHALDAIEKMATSLDIAIYRVVNPSLNLRTKGQVSDLINWLNSHSGLPYIVLIDESHELFNVNSTIPQKLFSSSLLRALDGKRDGGELVQVNEEESYPCNPLFQSFIFATNFPHLHGKRDKGATFNSRLAVLELETYTKSQLHDILHVMIENIGLKVDERSSQLIVDCARGSARPLSHVVNKLASKALAQGKKTCNKLDILESLKALNAFPLGLYPFEVSCLALMSTQPRTLKSLIAIHSKEESAIVRKGVAYLTNIVPSNAQETLATEKSGYLVATTTGATYISQLKKLGFTLPEIH